MRALILSCGTGEGHNSAAYAIEQSLKEKGVYCRTLDVLSFKSANAGKRAAEVYGAVIKRAPAVFGIAYTLGKWYDNLCLPSPIYRANAKYAVKLYRYISENLFDCVICTHLFAMEAMTAVRKKFGAGVKCYGVMTDYTAHPFIKDTDLDGYFVSCEEVKNMFVKKGVCEEKIYCTGIPVNAKFSMHLSKKGAAKFLNIPDGKRAVVVMTGGAGCGKVIKLCKRLNKALPGEFIIYALTGRNKKLKARADKVFKGGRVKAVGFTPDAYIYLKAADLVITKPGGLSSTEAAVANVPAVHLRSVYGLETANMKYFVKNGMAFGAKTVKKAVKNCLKLLDDKQCREAMRKLQSFYISSSAAREIADKITEGQSNERFFMESVYNRGISCGQYNVRQSYPDAAVS